MLFEDVKIDLPCRYPPNVENDPEKKIFYTLGNWIGDCINNNFFDFFSNEQLEERYKQVLRNYNVFVSPENDVIPIDFFYSSWYWTRLLYQYKVIFSFRNLSEPKIDFGYNLLPTYKTRYKPEIRKLFRFCELQYNLALVVNGNIRFSAASNYNTDDNKARNDNEMEKSFVYSGYGTKIITMDGKEIPCIGTATTTFPANNYYLSCFSLQYNPLFYKEMPNYDSCVIIHNYPEFCRRVQTAFMKLFKASENDFIFSPVGYYDKYSKVDGLKKKLVPYLDKDLSYAWEEEFRFMAFPKNYSEPHFYLNVGSLKDIAEIVCIKPRGNVEELVQKFMPNTVYKNGMYIKTSI